MVQILLSKIEYCTYYQIRENMENRTAEEVAKDWAHGNGYSTFKWGEHPLMKILPELTSISKYVENECTRSRSLIIRREFDLNGDEYQTILHRRIHEKIKLHQDAYAARYNEILKIVKMIQNDVINKIVNETSIGSIIDDRSDMPANVVDNVMDRINRLMDRIGYDMRSMKFKEKDENGDIDESISLSPGLSKSSKSSNSSNHPNTSISSSSSSDSENDNEENDNEENEDEEEYEDDQKENDDEENENDESSDYPLHYAELCTDFSIEKCVEKYNKYCKSDVSVEKYFIQSSDINTGQYYEFDKNTGYNHIVLPFGPFENYETYKPIKIKNGSKKKLLIVSFTRSKQYKRPLLPNSTCLIVARHELNRDNIIYSAVDTNHVEHSFVQYTNCIREVESEVQFKRFGAEYGLSSFPCIGNTCIVRPYQDIGSFLVFDKRNDDDNRVNSVVLPSAPFGRNVKKFIKIENSYDNILVILSFNGDKVYFMILPPGRSCYVSFKKVKVGKYRYEIELIKK